MYVFQLFTTLPSRYACHLPLHREGFEEIPQTNGNRSDVIKGSLREGDSPQCGEMSAKQTEGTARPRVAKQLRENAVKTVIGL